MGQRIAGTFNGTGAALHIGIGFVPDWVYVRNLEDSIDSSVTWNKHMNRFPDYPEGIEQYTGTTYRQDADLAFGGGIRKYYGGDVFTSTQTAYLIKDDNNYVTSSYGTINAWTLDTAGTPTGHFNVEADTTYVGEGSMILIDGKEYGITAMTSNGESTDEVTLSEAAPSGVITFIGNLFDYVGVTKNIHMPAGFSINATDVINVSGEACFFEAGTYDN